MFTKEMFDQMYTEAAFERVDESDDAEFYKNERIVDHLDNNALETVENLIENLVVEDSPVILDLMAGWNSHIPESIKPSKVIGLGLNKKELEENKNINEIIIQDINKNTALPFQDNHFDVVLNTISVDYMIKPKEIFEEITRILKPGGVFIVIFSDRVIKQKVIRIWKESNNTERLMYIEDLFQYSGEFEKQTVFMSMGRPRPEDDKYYTQGRPGDPIFAVYAEKKGGSADRAERPKIKHLRYGDEIDEAQLSESKSCVGEKLICPHCNEKLKNWRLPDDADSSWDEHFMYVCFNDSCPKFVNGYDVMCSQGNIGCSIRFVYSPKRDNCFSLPVNTYNALKEGIED